MVALAWSSLAFCGEIHDATERGDVEKVKTLLAADPSLVNAQLPSNKGTPLIFAIVYAKPEVAKLLLEKGADVNAKASNGQTALHQASAYGQLEVVKLLLERGASVNFEVKDDAQGGDPGCTPLLLAAENGHLEIVKLLLGKKADVNARASYNTLHQSATPLIAATKVSADYEKLGGGPLAGNACGQSKQKARLF